MRSETHARPHTNASRNSTARSTTLSRPSRTPGESGILAQKLSPRSVERDEALAELNYLTRRTRLAEHDIDPTRDYQPQNKTGEPPP